MSEIIICTECSKTFDPERIVRCYDCGKPYCLECAGGDWIGVCPDCEEVFETEEDYWDWE